MKLSCRPDITVSRFDTPDVDSNPGGSGWMAVLIWRYMNKTDLNWIELCQHEGSV